MKVRTAKISDIESIIPVFMDYEKASEGYLSEEYKSMRNKKKPLKKHIKLAFDKDIQQKNGKFLVVEDEDKIVGYIFGEVRDDSHPLFKRPKTGEFNDLAVLKSYQGKGIASKLWNELENWFVKKNCEMVTLSVNINNSAQEIYAKWGFEKFYLRMIKKLR
jgi:ribosomal protein S18 acetylase RimI-like enzyme